MRELLRVAALIEPSMKDDGKRAALSDVRRSLKATATAGAAEPAPATLVASAWRLLDLAPDHEEAHVVALRALLGARAGQSDPSLAAALDARAARFVGRFPFSPRAREVLADVRLAAGDEEGQLRVLSECGDACHTRLTEAIRTWQRQRCTAEGMAESAVLRISGAVVATASDIDHVELDPPRAPGPSSTSPEAACTATLTAEAAARARSLTAQATPDAPATLLVLRGILLVGESTLTAPVDGRAVRLPASTCARVCVKPGPRALPAGVSPTSAAR